MKIVIAPDSFKESLTALEVAKAIEQGFRQILPDAQYVTLPMADGGEGTVQSMVDALGGKTINMEVTDPPGRAVTGFFGISRDNKTAIIEMAAASGLHLVALEVRNPLLTTSYGTGELIRAALDHGVSHIILGIGGSATNDGGAGLAQALGARLLDNNQQPIRFGGEALKDLACIDLSELDHRLSSVTIDVACDVDNPLCGPKGASAVFGVQKGATPEMVKTLDSNLAHFARLIEQQLSRPMINIKGAGAAGGAGAALVGLLGANLRSGIDIVMDTVKLEEAIRDADLVITGEGRIDRQTIYGKTPVGVAHCAKRYGIPVIGIAGSLTDDSAVVHEHGIDAVFSVMKTASTLDDALKNAHDNIVLTARNIAAVYQIGVVSKD